MKVLLVVPELFAAEGGIARVMRHYLRALSDARGEASGVSLVALNDTVFPPDKLLRYSGDPLKAAEPCGASRTAFIARTFRAAARCDLAICGHIGQLPVLWAARLLYRKLPYVLVAHGVEVWRPFSWIERQALRGAKEIWCVSDFTRRELLRFSGLPEKCAVVLPNTLDPCLRPVRRTPPTGTPTLLSVSRLSYADRYKGIEHVIAALREVRARVDGTTLRIVGTGDDLPRLRELACAHGVADAVHFLGALSDEALSSEFDRCTAFVLPSKCEGFGLVFLEAMAHGKPCVGADAAAIPDIVSRETGMLPAYGDVAGIASACVHVLTATWDAEAIRSRADTFSFDKFQKQLRSRLQAARRAPLRSSHRTKVRQREADR
jgi:phosphatidyl-myo-inositol dimannoside synthase